MQLFSADTTIFKKNFAHENIKKLPSKVAYFTAQKIQYCQPAQNQPKSHILFHGSPRDLYSKLTLKWTLVLLALQK